jgi:hypothetical protein
MESRVHWKKRQKQIQYLQMKHGNDRSLARELPDLKVEQRTAPCSNGMRGSTARRVLPPGMKQISGGSLSQARAGADYPRHGFAMDGWEEAVRSDFASSPGGN